MMKRVIVLGSLILVIGFFIAGCEKAEVPKPDDTPAAVPTEPAPAPGEEGTNQ